MQASFACVVHHRILGRQRRGLAPRFWSADLQKHFWERERIAWLEGAKLESRQETFPRRRVSWESDSASSDSECDFVQNNRPGIVVGSDNNSCTGSDDSANNGLDDDSDDPDNGSNDGPDDGSGTITRHRG